MADLKIHLGLLGADDSVTQIEDVAGDFPEIELHSIVYWKESDVIRLLQPHLDSVSMWLFSGKVPYSIAQQWGGIAVPSFYVPHTGASLYKTLLYLAHEQHLPVSQLSFDTLHPAELSNLMDEVGITAPFHLRHYENLIDPDDLVQYHYELWASGQTKAAVTCVRSTHLELIGRHVPAYHIVPARDAIAAVLESIVQTHSIIHLQGAQIAVQLMDTPSIQPDDLALETERQLHLYAKRLHGVCHALKHGRFEVIATRGPVEEATQEFSSLPGQNILVGLPINRLTCGIGIGHTLAEANDHAYAALRHAQNRGIGSWYGVLEDKTVIGPLGFQQETLTYSYADSVLQELSQHVSLSVTTLSKLQSIIQLLDRDQISANELAESMNILPRSARRILMVLEQHGLASIVGEQAPYVRGRPRKVYRIHFPTAEA
jgi:hypothetical protein